MEARLYRCSRGCGSRSAKRGHSEVVSAKSMAPARTLEERLTALEPYVGQMLGNLQFIDAALTETSVVGHLVQQIELGMKSFQVELDGNDMVLKQTRITLDKDIGVMKTSIATEIDQMKSIGNLAITEL